MAAQSVAVATQELIPKAQYRVEGGEMAHAATHSITLCSQLGDFWNTFFVPIIFYKKKCICQKCTYMFNQTFIDTDK